MTVIVNGTATAVQPGTTIADLVAASAGDSNGIAVALNNEVVVRSRWESMVVEEQDHIELLGAVQGG